MKLFKDKFDLFFNDLTLHQFKEECLSKSLKALQVKNGNIPKWNKSIDELESYSKGELGLNKPYISIQNVGTSSENIELSLRKLLPWRKGPFLLNDLVLESEWHGDLKWQRLNKRFVH
jgi:tRNA (mo5U34)-methyltransferase